MACRLEEALANKSRRKSHRHLRAAAWLNTTDANCGRNTENRNEDMLPYGILQSAPAAALPPLHGGDRRLPGPGMP